MKTKHIMIVTLSAGLSAFTLAAQDNARPEHPRPGPRERGPDGPGHKPPMPPIIGALDANHDGVISTEEIANASAALKTLDKNGDGQLTMEELRPKLPPGAGEPKDGPPPRGPRPDGEKNFPRPDGDKNFHPPVPPIMAALDANHDGIISADEIANASKALGKLDKNGDGQIQKEELRPEPPPRREN